MTKFIFFYGCVLLASGTSVANPIEAPPVNDQLVAHAKSKISGPTSSPTAQVPDKKESKVDTNPPIVDTTTDQEKRRRTRLDFYNYKKMIAERFKRLRNKRKDFCTAAASKKSEWVSYFVMFVDLVLGAGYTDGGQSSPFWHLEILLVLDGNLTVSQLFVRLWPLFLPWLLLLAIVLAWLCIRSRKQRKQETWSRPKKYQFQLLMVALVAGLAFGMGSAFIFSDAAIHSLRDAACNYYSMTDDIVNGKLSLSSEQFYGWNGIHPILDQVETLLDHIGDKDGTISDQLKNIKHGTDPITESIKEVEGILGYLRTGSKIASWQNEQQFKKYGHQCKMCQLLYETLPDLQRILLDGFENNVVKLQDLVAPASDFNVDASIEMQRFVTETHTLRAGAERHIVPLLAFEEPVFYLTFERMLITLIVLLVSMAVLNVQLRFNRTTSFLPSKVKTEHRRYMQILIVTAVTCVILGAALMVQTVPIGSTCMGIQASMKDGGNEDLASALLQGLENVGMIKEHSYMSEVMARCVMGKEKYGRKGLLPELGLGTREKIATFISILNSENIRFSEYVLSNAVLEFGLQHSNVVTWDQRWIEKAQLNKKFQFSSKEKENQYFSIFKNYCTEVHDDKEFEFNGQKVKLHSMEQAQAKFMPVRLQTKQEGGLFGTMGMTSCVAHKMYFEDTQVEGRATPIHGLTRDAIKKCSQDRDFNALYNYIELHQKMTEKGSRQYACGDRMCDFEEFIDFVKMHMMKLSQAVRKLEFHMESRGILIYRDLAKLIKNRFLPLFDQTTPENADCSFAKQQFNDAKDAMCGEVYFEMLVSAALWLLIGCGVFLLYVMLYWQRSHENIPVCLETDGGGIWMPKSEKAKRHLRTYFEQVQDRVDRMNGQNAEVPEAFVDALQQMIDNLAEESRDQEDDEDFRMIMSILAKTKASKAVDLGGDADAEFERVLDLFIQHSVKSNEAAEASVADDASQGSADLDTVLLDLLDGKIQGAPLPVSSSVRAAGEKLMLRRTSITKDGTDDLIKNLIDDAGSDVNPDELDDMLLLLMGNESYKRKPVTEEVTDELLEVTEEVADELVEETDDVTEPLLAGEDGSGPRRRKSAKSSDPKDP